MKTTLKLDGVAIVHSYCSKGAVRTEVTKRIGSQSGSSLAQLSR